MHKYLRLQDFSDFTTIVAEGSVTISTGKKGFFVRFKGQDYGPFTIDELGAEIKAGRVSLSAWVYNDAPNPASTQTPASKSSWSLLATIESLRALHPEYEPEPTSIPGASVQKHIPANEDASLGSARNSNNATFSAEPIWFFIQSKKKFGPYSSADLIGMLQSKKIDRSVFVWRPGFQTWQRISQVNEFSRETMTKLTSAEILVKRKYPRAPYEVDVIVHDNTSAITGRTMVIGEGGLYLSTTETGAKLPRVGTRLKIHFREKDIPAFNAVAEVVSVMRGENQGFCMKFVAISESDRKKISKYVTERRTTS